jgi:hypothetical protein
MVYRRTNMINLLYHDILMSGIAIVPGKLVHFSILFFHVFGLSPLFIPYPIASRTPGF